MRHDISLKGVGFGLRPITTKDAAFIVELRTDPVLGKYLHATSPSIDDQVAWTERYFEREHDWYWVIENLHTTEPEGAVSIYNVDVSDKQAEWGRWIIRHGSLAALESAALIYDVGFDILGLDMLYTHTEDRNLPTVSFHTSMGSELYGPAVGPEGEQWTEQRMTRERWTEQRPALLPRIERVARSLARLP